MDLMTRDGYPADEAAIGHTSGATVVPPRTGQPGRPKAPDTAPRAGLTYAAVATRRETGRVVEILTRVVFGTRAAAVAARAHSGVGRVITTSFVGRPNGTDRHPNARKSRKTSRFSQDGRSHEAVT